MKNKPTSYARFYALLRQMQGDREQIKETLILQFTKGRTTSLREMQKDEYEAMCRAMEAEIEHPGLSTEEFRREQKRLRSAVLHRMQRLGVDTSDWDVVDAFCLSNRIARKEFARLSLAELRVMVSKLEAMGRKDIPGPAEQCFPSLLKPTNCRANHETCN